MIAAQIGMPLAMFQADRKPLMRDWYPASDGRLYSYFITVSVERLLLDRSRSAAAYAARSGRRPPWLTAEDRRQMEAIHLEAKRLSALTGVQYEVDHIIPLKGLLVSGLDVPWNLEPLPKQANRTKSNKWLS